MVVVDVILLQSQFHTHIHTLTGTHTHTEQIYEPQRVWWSSVRESEMHFSLVFSCPNELQSIHTHTHRGCLIRTSLKSRDETCCGVGKVAERHTTTRANRKKKIRSEGTTTWCGRCRRESLDELDCRPRERQPQDDDGCCPSCADLAARGPSFSQRWCGSASSYEPPIQFWNAAAAAAAAVAAAAITLCGAFPLKKPFV